MSVITSGKTFANGEQLSADKLNQVITGATFNASDAVDGSTIVLIGGAMAVRDDGITTVKIVNNAVTTAKIAADAVETANIKDANVTLPKIATQADQTVLANVSGDVASPTAVPIVDDAGILINNDALGTSDTKGATQGNIKAFAGMTPPQNGSGGGYGGVESVTLPNGLTMKFGRVAATSDSDYTVNFAEDFDNAVIFATAIANTSTTETISVQIKGTPAVGSMVVGIKDESHLTGFYWQAIGH